MNFYILGGFCSGGFSSPESKDLRSGPGKPNQRKVSSWTFRRGIPEQKFNVNRACFPKEKTPEFTKMGEIHELFVLALSLVWFAGATPEDKGRPSHDHDHFWVHLAGTPFFIFGVPPDDAPNGPSTQWNTEKPQRFFIWCGHQMPFWCGIRCKTILEDYGCGCVWAVPEKISSISQNNRSLPGLPRSGVTML